MPINYMPVSKTGAKCGVCKAREVLILIFDQSAAENYTLVCIQEGFLVIAGSIIEKHHRPHFTASNRLIRGRLVDAIVIASRGKRLGASRLVVEVGLRPSERNEK